MCALVASAALAPPSSTEVRTFRPTADAGVAKARAAHHAALRSKYERAARYPWLPVEPDPPEPE